MITPMRQAWTQDMPGIGRCIVILESDGFARTIPLAAIASCRELLGYSDPLQAFDAVVQLQMEGEPDPDPLTGRNVWTDSYVLLAERERAREKRALELTDYGTKAAPMNLVSESARAAYKTVHEPVAGGACVMDRCREDACKQIGVVDPLGVAGVASRHTPVTLPRIELSELLRGEEEELLKCSQRFLHSLTENDADPLPHIPDEEPETVTAEDVQKKFMGEDQAARSREGWRR